MCQEAGNNWCAPNSYIFYHLADWFTCAAQAGSSLTQLNEVWLFVPDGQGGSWSSTRPLASTPWAGRGGVSALLWGSQMLVLGGAPAGGSWQLDLPSSTGALPQWTLQANGTELTRTSFGAGVVSAGGLPSRCVFMCPK